MRAGADNAEQTEPSTTRHQSLCLAAGFEAGVGVAQLSGCQRKAALKYGIGRGCFLTAP